MLLLFLLILATSGLAFSPWWLLSLPGWLLLSNLLHEVSHMVAYRLTKLPFIRLQWGLVVYTPGKLSLDRTGKPWAAMCSCKAIPRPLYCYAIALLSGGVVTALVGIIFLLLQLWAPGIAFTLNGAVALLNPRSTDRRILKSLR